MERQVWAMDMDPIPTNPLPQFSTILMKFKDDSQVWVWTGFLDPYPQLWTAYKNGILEFEWLNERETYPFLHFLENGTLMRLPSVGYDEKEKHNCALNECLSLYGIAVEYKMHPLAQLAMLDFIDLAEELSIFELVDLLDAVDWNLDHRQVGLANYLSERATLIDETIDEYELAEFRLKNRFSQTFANIFLARVAETKLKLQKYEEKYGPLE